MMSKMKGIIITILLISNIVCHAGHVVGIVVSDCSSNNTATGKNLAADLVDLGESLRTVYMVSENDGKGYAVRLTHPYGNNLRRGDKVKVDLENPSISEIELLSRGNAVPVRKKHISELTPDDYYTLVALQGVEFRKKEGGYINVDERYVQRTSLNEMLALEGLDGFRPAREFADTWAIMLTDDQGSHIYCLINSTCEWRRNKVLPKGVGEIFGIIVPGDLPRYGSPIGDYAIRPIFESDVQIPAVEATSCKTLCSWNYDFNPHAEMNCLNAGIVRFPRPGQIVGDKILAETGCGLLWTDTGASITLGKETDARHSNDGYKENRNTGARSNAALRFDCKSSSWYRSRTEYNGIYVSASLKGVDAKFLHFNFSFVAGLDNSAFSEGFPVDWNVSYSTDGVSYTPLSDTLTLRPTCFINIRHKKQFLPVHIGCVPGFTEHRVDLPMSLLGKDFTIRLSPCSVRTASLPEEFDGPCCDGDIKDCKNTDMILRIGDISITYIQ